MPLYVVRVWLPDRPGALGQVASRVGAVGGDVVGLDILERGGGRVIDELVVDLPGGRILDLLITEIQAVDDVEVEDLRPATDMLRDPRLDALESAALLAEATGAAELLDTLVARSQRDFTGEWAAVVDTADPEVLATVGPAPGGAWLDAFVQGSRSSALAAAGAAGPDDVAWAPLPETTLVLVVGRRGRSLRARERRQVQMLARIAAARWTDLARVSSLRRHPSCTL